MSSLRVTLRLPGKDPQLFTFERPFRIGRSAISDLCIADEHVSRVHVAVEPENGGWSIKDLQSSNGLFLDGQRVETAAIGNIANVSLGISGPALTFEIVREADSTAPEGETQWLNRYFSEPPETGPEGERTKMVRRALRRIQQRHRWRYGVAIAVFALLIAGAAGYAIFLQRQLSRNKLLARDMFYSMKTIDIDVARAEQALGDSGGAGEQVVRNSRQRREQLEENYDRFLTALHVYSTGLDEKTRLILRVARIFGESELEMPDGFTDEVSKYIDKWRSSGRFVKAIRTAKENGYTEAIVREFLRHDLPPQFFYLAMQESDFDIYNSGPPTRKGIAKGMWQFIPETAARYGLKIGPLAELPRPDPADERDRFDLSTRAAARYIQDLYSTDAQASGLLVMACYNWGDDRVLPMVRAMPANPKERNFWKLLSQYRSRIPQETYDYVFYIVSAAVIGEDPRQFGFDFDNPLTNADKP